MAKGTSFADKSKKKKKISQTFVKYVKSIKSEKTGHWRFNEQMVGLNSGENLDGALKRIQEEALALDLVLPSLEEAVEQKKEAVKKDAEGLFKSIKHFLQELLDFREDTDRDATIEAIKNDIPFKEY